MFLRKNVHPRELRWRAFTERVSATMEVKWKDGSTSTWLSFSRDSSDMPNWESVTLNSMGLTAEWLAIGFHCKINKKMFRLRGTNILNILVATMATTQLIPSHLATDGGIAKFTWLPGICPRLHSEWALLLSSSQGQLLLNASASQERCKGTYKEGSSVVIVLQAWAHVPRLGDGCLLMTELQKAGRRHPKPTWTNLLWIL